MGMGAAGILLYKKNLINLKEFGGKGNSNQSSIGLEHMNNDI